MKSSISTLCPTFNMQRMVKQYAAEFYVTADERFQQLTANGSERARALAAWTSHVKAHWKEVRVESVDPLTHDGSPGRQPSAHAGAHSTGCIDAGSGRRRTLRGKTGRRWGTDRCLCHSHAGGGSRTAAVCGSSKAPPFRAREAVSTAIPCGSRPSTRTRRNHSFPG